MPISPTELATRCPGYPNVTTTGWQILRDACVTGFVNAGDTIDDAQRDELIVWAAKTTLAFQGINSISQPNYANSFYDNLHSIYDFRAETRDATLTPSSGGSTPTPGGLEVMSINVTQNPSSGEATIHVTRTDGTTQNFTISMNAVLAAAITEYTNTRIAGELTQRYGAAVDFGRDHSGGGTPPTPTTDTAYAWVSTSTVLVTAVPNDAVTAAFTRANSLPAISLRLGAVTANSYLYVALPATYAEPQVFAPDSFISEELTAATSIQVGSTSYNYWRTAGGVLLASVLNNGTVRLTA